MENALETSGLRRTFGSFVAVDDIDLKVPKGSFYGFLGPNGAGKSTSIKCLTGLLKPSGGSMKILGLDPVSHPIEVKKQVGVVPEDLALFEKLTGLETLRFVAEVHRIEQSEIRKRSNRLLEVMDLVDAGASVVADYSHGMRKKLALSAALITAPQLLFLDEPFEGIDAVASRQIKDLLANFVRGGGTIFLTSHILEIVESLCDVIGVIHKGRLVAQGRLSDLQAGRDGKSLEQIFLGLVGAEEGEAPRGLDWL